MKADGLPSLLVGQPQDFQKSLGTGVFSGRPAKPYLPECPVDASAYQFVVGFFKETHDL